MRGEVISAVTNESDNKLILFERRFDVIFTSLSSLTSFSKMTSKRRSNKIYVESLPNQKPDYIFKLFILRVHLKMNSKLLFKIR